MEKLYERVVRRFKAVSFDVFDTLLERECDSPEDVFLNVGERELGKGMGKRFVLDRVNAEKIALQKKNGEVNLSEIYSSLPCEYDDVKEKLKMKEIEEEIRVCKLKKKIKEIYDVAISDNKIILLISDMYLPKDVIESILSKNGITGYHSLYVSNEIGCTKREGSAYEYVLRENNLRSGDIVHIGDSIKADFLGAIKNGIFPLLVARKQRLKRFLGQVKL